MRVSNATSDTVLTMRPWPLRASAAQAACTVPTGPTKFTPRTRSSPASVTDSIGSLTASPALFTTMSSPP